MVGAILAGGSSSRMGTDKALLEVEGRPMARHVAEAMWAAGADVVVLIGASAATSEALGLSTILDDPERPGPLPAVATAVARAAIVWRAVEGREPQPIIVWKPAGSVGDVDDPAPAGSAGGDVDDGRGTTVPGGPRTGAPSDPLDRLRRAVARPSEPTLLRQVGHEPDDGSGLRVLVAACDQPGLTPAVLRGLLDHLEAPGGAGAVVAVPVTPDGRRHPLPAAYRQEASGALRDLVRAGERRASAGFDVLAVAEVAVRQRDIEDLDTPADVARWAAGATPGPGGLPGSGASAP